MIRWGKTARGTPRYRCSSCKTTGVRRRSDRKEKNKEVLFERWLLSTETLERLSHSRGTKKSALLRSFDRFWKKQVSPLPYQGENHTLIVDGIVLGRDSCVLIAIDGNGKPITWLSCARENSTSWGELFEQVKQAGFLPSLIVSDAQKGLLKGMKSEFPSIVHQRCMAHIVRLARGWLTRRPRTRAGQDLRMIIGMFYGIRTKSEATRFMRLFKRWRDEYHEFLKEKSVSPETGRRWYTHRRLRKVQSLIAGALPDVFTFLETPNAPRTTNILEGGVNSPLKALLRHHRGLTNEHKRVLVFRFLCARQKKKPTRGVN